MSSDLCIIYSLNKMILEVVYIVITPNDGMILNNMQIVARSYNHSTPPPTMKKVFHLHSVGRNTDDGQPVGLFGYMIHPFHRPVLSLHSPDSFFASPLEHMEKCFCPNRFPFLLCRNDALHPLQSCSYKCFCDKILHVLPFMISFQFFLGGNAFFPHLLVEYLFPSWLWWSTASAYLGLPSPHEFVNVWFPNYDRMKDQVWVTYLNVIPSWSQVALFIHSTVWGDAVL